MVTLNNIKPNSGSRKISKRLGRGNSSGKGTYCGKGCKGQNARSGGGVPDWFEGGQTPLFRRMPKLKGFSNKMFKKSFNEVNLSDISLLVEKGFTEINADVLFENRVIRKKNLPIKLLGNGELKAKVSLTVNKASVSAKEKVEKAGGSLVIK